ncbi:hypothetical protein [Anaerophilus nitritogenes]|uniref:hypothetical protein n=1 Tax=Anaerophilus nitritogenes TaxID=2498136 RepID=UPI00101C82B3|nr:hypothetical protein [Anaerophilus nitritogenes]
MKTFNEFKKMEKNEKWKISENNPLHLEILKSEIKKKNFKKVNLIFREFNQMLKEDKIIVSQKILFNKFFMQSVLVTVTGYGNDSRELYEIKEVIEYFELMYRKHPYMFFYLKEECQEFIMFSLIQKHLKIMKKINSENILSVSNNKITELVNEISENNVDFMNKHIFDFTNECGWNEVYLPIIKFINDDKEHEILKTKAIDVMDIVNQENTNGVLFINDDDLEHVYNIIIIKDIEWGNIPILLKIENKNKVNEETTIFIGEIAIDTNAIDSYKWKDKIDGQWKSLAYDSLLGLQLLQH